MNLSQVGYTRMLMKKNKKPKQDMAEVPQKQGSSFMTGVMMGTIVGGLGVYFTKTDKGKKTWKKLQTKWEKHKKKLVEEGTLEDVGHTLEGWLTQMVEKFSAEQMKKQAAAKKPSKKKRVRKKKTTFKGV